MLSRTFCIVKPRLTEVDSWNNSRHITLSYTYPSLYNHGHTCTASMLCSSATQASLGSVLLGYDPSWRLLLYLSSDLSSLSPNFWPNGSLKLVSLLDLDCTIGCCTGGDSDGKLLFSGDPGSAAMFEKTHFSSCL